MTSKNGGEIKSLFITQVRPFKPASKDTIARWIRETLSKAGIDTSIFSPHSIRSAASSTAKKGPVSINTILKTEGWRSTKAFGGFTIRTLLKEKMICKIINCLYFIYIIFLYISFLYKLVFTIL